MLFHHDGDRDERCGRNAFEFNHEKQREMEENGGRQRGRGETERVSKRRETERDSER
jgi:hypothetical protein